MRYLPYHVGARACHLREEVNRPGLDNMKLTVVSPTFNEAENISALITELERALAGLDYEIVISDDNSPDRTWALVEEIGRLNPRIRVLRRYHKPGLGWSVIDGFSRARGDLLACIDADLQHDPAVLPTMIECLEGGADLVVGSRYVHGGSVGDWRFWRRAESWLATKLAHWLTGIRICDPMSGYFLLRQCDFLDVKDRLDGQGFKILLELAANMPRARICELPYSFRKRRSGRTKLSRRVIFAYCSQLWRLSRLSHGRKNK